MKSRDGKSQGREEEKKEDQKRESSQKKEDPGARKGGEVAKHRVFPMICGSGGSKSTVTTFEYVEGGPDYEAPEVV